MMDMKLWYVMPFLILLMATQSWGTPSQWTDISTISADFNDNNTPSEKEPQNSSETESSDLEIDDEMDSFNSSSKLFNSLRPKPKSSSEKLYSVYPEVEPRPPRS